ncbi:hypothetical protein E2C01_085629 [Portunus trituberculatus]|uniref:Uncharacterized protein n=1 Tax=Portunus trituberculatus TaxID=210409 RepID=A0A5B7J3A0_PORTR|nr:hypothetical protein [Portunus trituberculatus]
MAEMFGQGSVNTHGLTSRDSQCPEPRAKTARKGREKQQWKLACFRKAVKSVARGSLEDC